MNICAFSVSDDKWVKIHIISFSAGAFSFKGVQQ